MPHYPTGHCDSYCWMTLLFFSLLAASVAPSDSMMGGGGALSGSVLRISHAEQTVLSPLPALCSVVSRRALTFS